MDIYTVRLVGACAIAALWLSMTAPQHAIATPEFLVAIWALTLSVLIAGRAGYAWAHRDYFAQNPADVAHLGRVGGLNGATAWGGGLLATAVWAKLRGRRFKRLIGWLTPPALLVAAGAWGGCLHTGCAWGRETLQPPRWLQWLVAESPDLRHSIRPRYAVRTAGLVAALFTTAGALALGEDGIYGLVLYLAGETGLTLLRGNPVPTAGSFRMDTLLIALWTILLLLFTALPSSRSDTETLDLRNDRLRTLD